VQDPNELLSTTVAPGEPIVQLPGLETLELRVGRFQVPEDADDMLGLAHRLPGVVHVWLNGSTLSLECEPGAVDRDAVVSRLQDDGYPVRSA
jgi:hypothetical protein